MTFETGIPIPPGRGGRQKTVHSLTGMGVDQSHFFPLEDSRFSNIHRLQKAVSSSAAFKFGAGNYKTRIMEDPNRGLGVRVWRTG